MSNLIIGKNFDRNINQINEIVFKAQLDKVILAAQKQYDFTAMELSVSSSYKPYSLNIYYGNMSKSSNEPINSDSIFQVGSITKTFTAAAILNLLSEHKIKLTDTVDKFLPDYKSWSNITIGQLMNQTSGIFDYSDTFLWWSRLYLFSFLNWTPEELLAIVADGKSYFEPSQGWHYSNTNYVILGLIIEKITQQKLANYFTQNFLQTHSLSLNHTYYMVDNPPSNIKNSLAHGYFNNRTDMTNINTSWLQAGGGMLSNADDLSKWYLFYAQQIINNKAVFNQFVDIKDGKLLSDFSHIGYGFAVFAIPTPYGLIFVTLGLTPGYTSLVGYLPCKNVSFSYIITSGFKKQNIHQYLLSKILPIIAQNISDANSMPECRLKLQSKEIMFPDF